MSLEKVSEYEFDEEVLRSDKPVLVDVYADWCGPCKQIAPLLEEVSNENESVKIVKFNVEDGRDIAVKYGVRGVPTLLYFVNGELVKTKVGMVTKNQIIEFIS
jgi:thioredoxin